MASQIINKDKYLIKNLKGEWVKQRIPRQKKCCYYFNYVAGLRALVDTKSMNCVILVTDYNKKEIVYNRWEQLNELGKYDVI